VAWRKRGSTKQIVRVGDGIGEIDTVWFMTKRNYGSVTRERADQISKIMRGVDQEAREEIIDLINRKMIEEETGEAVATLIMAVEIGTETVKGMAGEIEKTATSDVEPFGPVTL